MGVGMWAAAGRDGPPPCGLNEQMRLPGPVEMDARSARAVCRRRQVIHVLARLQLFAVATFFLVATGSVTLVNLALRKLGLGCLPGAATLVNFVGDVMVYRRPTPAENVPITDLGHPPRTAIRRRMVAALVDMATARYDRWYVVAHSLGSVVAFNGLTETAHCLPNYLDERRWRRLVRLGMAGPGEEGRDWPKREPDQGKVPPLHNMEPGRLVWLNDADVIHRDRLFANLRGFLTYGSPLDKFAALWPALVPLNKVQAVFPPEFEWINVYDPTDPVGGRLDGFEPVPTSEPAVAGQDLRPLRVTNLGYRASPWLLVSHVRYLRPGRGGRAGCLVDAVAHWVLGGGRFRVPSGSQRWFAPEAVEHLANGAASPRLVGRSAWRWVQWGVFGFLVTALTAMVLRGVPWVLPEWLTGSMTPHLSSMPVSVGTVVDWVTTGPFLFAVATVFTGAGVTCAVCGILYLVRIVFASGWRIFARNWAAREARTFATWPEVTLKPAE
jgi:hypothetical protein